MSFEHKYFTDGESAFHLPVWKQIVDTVHDDLDAFSYADEQARRQRYAQDEMGLKHPKNGSFIRIKDDGTIEAFNNKHTGLRIVGDRIQLFGDHVQLIGHETQVVSSPNASHVNGTPMDGNYPVFRQKGLTESMKTLIEGGED